jgi:hypothetical protein
VRYEGYGIESVVQFLRDAEALATGATTRQHLEQTQTRPTFRQALPSVQVVEAVNKSLITGAPVAVSSSAATAVRHS